MSSFKRELAKALKRQENKVFNKCIYYDLSRRNVQNYNEECLKCDGYRLNCDIFKELKLGKPKNKPYVRCKYYELARTSSYRDLSFVVTERPNGEIETRGCQDCNGYNVLCDVYKEWYLK